MNVVPKEGGNTFKSIGSGLWTNDKLETNTLTDGLREKGVTETNPTNKIFDNAASLGGPIVQNKMWFFGAARTWGMARQFAGLYWNRGQRTLLSPPGADLEVVTYDPWVDRPFDSRSGRWEWYDSFLGRVTYQPNPKNKFNFLIDHQHACNCGGATSNVLNEATGGYPVRAEHLHAVDVQLVDHEQAAARGRHRGVAVAVERVLDDRDAGQTR